MTERSLTTIFSNYLKEHSRDFTETYEFKMVKGLSFPFKSVQPHQIIGLQQSKLGLWYKIQDSPFGGNNQRFTSKKPFDGIWMKASEAFVVPIFYKERKYKKAFLIPIEEFLKFQGTSIKLTELESREFTCIHL